MADDESDPRRRILDAAERAFADGGLAGARVAGIAEAAGLNKATLYHYFETKEALYQAVLERTFAQVVDAAVQVAADVEGPPDQALWRFLEAYAEILAQHPSVVRIMLRGVLDSGGTVPEDMIPRLSRVLPALAGLVARGQAEGGINSRLEAPLVPPSLVAPIVFVSFAAPTLASITGIPEADLRARWLGNLRELSLNGLTARPEEE